MALTRICLDTSAYSHYKRGDARAVEVLSRATRVGIPAVVLGELRAGFRRGGRAERNERELLEFLRHPLVEMLPIDDEVASIYADIVIDLRRGGTPIPTNDVWIAALAARDGSVVVTYDALFEQIARIGAKVLSTE